MFDLANAKIKIYNFDDHKYKGNENFRVEDIVLPYYVMSYIKKGNAKVLIDGKEIPHTEGTIVILPPNVPHTHYKDCSTTTEFLWWHFDYMFADVIDVIKMLDVPLCFKLNNKESFEKLFREYNRLANEDADLCTSIRLEALKLEIMAAVFKNVNLSVIPSVTIPDAFLEMFNRIINCTNKDLSLHELGEDYFLHPTYVTNRFKQHFGITPMDLKRKVIIDRAKVLLKNTNKSINDIASQLGYEELSTFTRLFTDKVGISPRQYRNLNLNE